MNDAIDIGDAEQKLVEAGNAPATVNNLLRAQTMLDTYNFKQKVNKASEDIIISDYTNLLEMGALGPTEMSVLRDKVSAPTFAKFQLAVDRFERAQRTEQVSNDYFLNNKDNTIALANLSTEEKDRGFQALVLDYTKGQQPTLSNEAMVAQEVQATISSFNKKLSAGINSNDPQQSVASSQIYRSLSRNNSLSVAGIGDKSALKAQAINDFKDAQVSDLDAWKLASSQIDNLTPADIKAREEMFSEQLRAREYRSTTEKLMWAQKATGLEDAPPGMAQDFEKSVKNFYMLGGDWDRAEEMAGKAINNRYGVSEFNGQKQTVLLPIEKNWPGGDNEIYLQNLFIDRIERLSLMQKDQFNAGNAGFYYEFAEGAITPEGNILTDSRMRKFRPGFLWAGSAKHFPGVRVDAAGNKIEGLFIISSDALTEINESGVPPSYGILFQPKDKILPSQVYDENNLCRQI